MQDVQVKGGRGSLEIDSRLHVGTWGPQLDQGLHGQLCSRVGGGDEEQPVAWVLNDMGSLHLANDRWGKGQVPEWHRSGSKEQSSRESGSTDRK